MSVCSASSASVNGARFPRAATVMALLVAASLAFAPAAAHAESKVTIKSGDKTRVVDVDRHGITVTRVTTDHDSDSTWTGSDFHAGPIIVKGNGSGIVRLFSDAEVGPGQTVDGDVVAVFGSVKVEGTVVGSAVAVFGSLDLSPQARIQGDAVAVGGGIREEPGANVQGQTVQVGFLPFTLGLPGLPMVIMSIVIGWLITVFFGWAAAMLFPARLTRVAVTASRRTAASLVLGVFSGPLMLMAMLLLMVTVVGIPIAFFLPLAWFAVTYAGQIAATYVLGCKLTRRPLTSTTGIVGALAAGSLLVASVFGFGAILWETPGAIRTVALFFMLVGVLLVLGLSAIGAGAFMLSRAGSRPHDIGEPGAGPAPAPSPSGATVTS